MGPPVPGELVRSGELPAAAWPVAGEGLLPGVSPHVGLQVTLLGVQLPAAGLLALEHLVLVPDVGLGRGVPPGDAGPMRQVVLVIQTLLLLFTGKTGLRAWILNTRVCLLYS